MLFGSFALFLAFRPAADARANSTLDWLSAEPVTLMDLGIIRLKQDLAQVGQRLLEVGFLPVLPTTGAYYDWRDKKITVFLTARERFAQPSDGMCLELFARVAKGLASRSRGHQGDPGWYLEEIFTHDGWGNFTRPTQMREDLLKTVRLEVTLLPPQPMGPARTLHCSGRLDTKLDDVSIITS
ncbi:MAG: hypothetical protein CMM77_03345 [Rhodospirillaceae bacterium]|nr:hypothetical protein [Rhodospirillaceae bacterium]